MSCMAATCTEYMYVVQAATALYINYMYGSHTDQTTCIYIHNVHGTGALYTCIIHGTASTGSCLVYYNIMYYTWYRQLPCILQYHVLYMVQAAGMAATQTELHVQAATALEIH